MNTFIILLVFYHSANKVLISRVDNFNHKKRSSVKLDVDGLWWIGRFTKNVLLVRSIVVNEHHFTHTSHKWIFTVEIY